ncbi:unnamed protein product [Acanthoscelides obtectus]|uniref:Uncharacterized protein n=1 Tax=Acanthoscelides obtectus TaxID=200917 RepID=A0A9P0KSM9_ACAOB|nr:unnamed protein product [Acanthoscelides obtectus]CAK1659103.1 hypothetical protein AOBTE_LOCUS21279 [Acanthoscelides obtectus]
MKCNQDMILPSLDSCRRSRSTETIETMPSFDRSPSYLQNCNQIFIKGPALTREILEKMNEDLVPKQTVIFGYELNTKKFLYAAGLCLFTLLSFYGFLVMWFTDVFDNYALSVSISYNCTHENRRMT